MGKITALQIFNGIKSYLSTEWNDLEDLDIIEKSLKALEIIKNKKVDMKDLLGFFEWEEGFSYYNEYRKNEEKLTPEEYELLKEILK